MSLYSRYSESSISVSSYFSGDPRHSSALQWSLVVGCAGVVPSDAPWPSRGSPPNSLNGLTESLPATSPDVDERLPVLGHRTEFSRRHAVPLVPYPFVVSKTVTRMVVVRGRHQTGRRRLTLASTLAAGDARRRRVCPPPPAACPASAAGTRKPSRRRASGSLKTRPAAFPRCWPRERRAGRLRSRDEHHMVSERVAPDDRKISRSGSVSFLESSSAVSQTVRPQHTGGHDQRTRAGTLGPVDARGQGLRPLPGTARTQVHGRGTPDDSAYCGQVLSARISALRGSNQRGHPLTRGAAAVRTAPCRSRIDRHRAVKDRQCRMPFLRLGGAAGAMRRNRLNGCRLSPIITACPRGITRTETRCPGADRSPDPPSCGGGIDYGSSAFLPSTRQPVSARHSTV